MKEASERAARLGSRYSQICSEVEGGLEESVQIAFLPSLTELLFAHILLLVCMRLGTGEILMYD